jgi:hypothetical protein
VPLDERLLSFLDALLALERAIYDRPLMNALPAILPAKRDMHHAVENPERFPAFWRAPQNGQAHAGNNPLNQVAALSVEIDVLEANEANAALDGTTRQANLFAGHNRNYIAGAAPQFLPVGIVQERENIVWRLFHIFLPKE